MKNEEYAYSVAYIKTLENKMFSQSELDLLKAADLQGAMQFLTERGYSPDDALQKAYNKAAKVLENPPELQILFWKNDFHNLKAVLKAVFTGIAWQSLVLFPAQIAPAELEKAIKSGEYSALPEFIRDNAKGAYELFSKSPNPQLAEIYIDDGWKRAVTEASKKVGNDFLIGYFELINRLCEYKALWRQARLKDGSKDIEKLKSRITKEFPKAKVSTISDFEMWCAETVLSYARGFAQESFSIHPILAFLVKTEFEARLVEKILTDKKSGDSYE